MDATFLISLEPSPRVPHSGDLDKIASAKESKKAKVPHPEDFGRIEKTRSNPAGSSSGERVWANMEKALNKNTGTAIRWINHRYKTADEGKALLNQSIESLINAGRIADSAEKENDRKIIRARVNLWISLLVRLSNNAAISDANKRLIMAKGYFDGITIASDNEHKYLHAEKGLTYKGIGEIKFEAAVNSSPINDRGLLEAISYLEKAREFLKKSNESFAVSAYADALAIQANILLIRYQNRKGVRLNDIYNLINEAKNHPTNTVKIISEKIESFKMSLPVEIQYASPIVPNDISYAIGTYYFEADKDNKNEWEIKIKEKTGSRTIAKITRNNNKLHISINGKTFQIKYAPSSKNSDEQVLSLTKNIVKNLNNRDPLAVSAQSIGGKTFIVDSILYTYLPNQSVLFEVEGGGTSNISIRKESAFNNYQSSRSGVSIIKGIVEQNPNVNTDPILLERQLDKIEAMTASNDLEKIKIGINEINLLFNNPLINVPKFSYIKARALLMLSDFYARTKSYNNAKAKCEELIRVSANNNLPLYFVEGNLRKAEYSIMLKDFNASESAINDALYKLHNYSPKTEAESENAKLLEAKANLVLSKRNLYEKKYPESSNYLNACRQLLNTKPKYYADIYQNIQDEISLLSVEIKFDKKELYDKAGVESILPELYSAQLNKSFYSRALILIVKALTASKQFDLAIKKGNDAISLYKNDPEFENEMNLEIASTMTERGIGSDLENATAKCLNVLGLDVNAGPSIKKKAALTYILILLRQGSKSSIREANSILNAWESSKPAGSLEIKISGKNKKINIEPLHKTQDSYFISLHKIINIKDSINAADFKKWRERNEVLQKAEIEAKNILKGREDPHIKKQALLLYREILSRQTLRRKDYRAVLSRINNINSTWKSLSQSSALTVTISDGADVFEGVEKRFNGIEKYIDEDDEIYNIRNLIEQKKFGDTEKEAIRILNSNIYKPYINKQALSAFVDILGRQNNTSELAHLINKAWKEKSSSSKGEELISFTVTAKIKGGEKTLAFSNIEPLNLPKEGNKLDENKSNDNIILLNFEITEIRYKINQSYYADDKQKKNQMLEDAKAEAFGILKKDCEPAIKKQALESYCLALRQQNTRQSLEEAYRIYDEWEKKSKGLKPNEFVTIIINGAPCSEIEPIIV